MLRPSNEEFIEWAKHDNNVSKIQDTLRIHPDLVQIKNEVSLILCRRIC